MKLCPKYYWFPFFPDTVYKQRNRLKTIPRPLMYRGRGNNSNTKTMFTVQWSWPLHECTPFIWWILPITHSRLDQVNWPWFCVSACKLLVPSPTINIYCHYLLVLSSTADIHFIIPLRVQGWVSLDGWLTNLLISKYRIWWFLSLTLLKYRYWYQWYFW